jgi:hypothetical protein
MGVFLSYKKAKMSCKGTRTLGKAATCAEKSEVRSEKG